MFNRYHTHKYTHFIQRKVTHDLFGDSIIHCDILKASPPPTFARVIRHFTSGKRWTVNGYGVLVIAIMFLLLSARKQYINPLSMSRLQFNTLQIGIFLWAWQCVKEKGIWQTKPPQEKATRT